MKKFNQTIQIEFEVDAIATQLRNMFKDDSANADLVVEQIIGRSLTSDPTMLSKIVAGMNGVQKEIFVKPGEKHTIKPLRVYGYWTKESMETNNSCYGDVTKVIVLETDPYKDKEVKVGYDVPSNAKGEIKQQTQWISASMFTL